MAQPGHHVSFEPGSRRVRVVISGKTVADTLKPSLLIESGKRPVWYFPREDVRCDLIEAGGHAPDAAKGEATQWTLTIGNRRIENALVSHDAPPADLARMKGHLAFAADKVDHVYEEDEEVFGHAPDPYHRVDVRPSSRRVRVTAGGQVIANTARAIFLFETGHPTRYYIPQADIRMDLLMRTERSTVCPYKGFASYWSIAAGERVIENAVWGYLDPLPECPRIKNLLCFYPEKVDAIEIEGG
jgi:uncharacterized protein (DUF427 family)